MNAWRFLDGNGKTLEERIEELRIPHRGYRRMLLEHGCTVNDLADLRAAWRRDLYRLVIHWTAVTIIPPPEARAEVLKAFGKPKR